jgi:hypothetical protein
MTIRRGKDKGKAIVEVKDETRQRLERLGREPLAYKAFALTGLRKRELAPRRARIIRQAATNTGAAACS